MAKLLDSHIYGTLISDGLITAKSNIDVGTYLKINTSNALGKPSINIGKPGNNFLGIGSKDTTSSHTIRYGASDGTSWLTTNTSYIHEFDGSIKASTIYENGSRVWTAARFDPNTKLNVAGGTITGTLTVNTDINAKRDLFVTRNFSVNGNSIFANDITVAGVKFSQKLGINDNAVSASKLKNPVTINGVLFDGTQNIVVKAEATGGISDTCRGNAGTATKLQTPRTINGVAFDGSTNISITAPANGGTSASCTGNAGSATKLQTPRTINGVLFDGTSNISITAPANGGTSASCSGNAASASKLLHSLTINGQSFNGSKDMTITIDDKNKLPITGGTLTGSLNIQGELVCTGNVTAFATSLSDRRLKENIIPITNATDIINKINIYSFNFKDNPAKRYGVIAQEVKEILPEVITETPIPIDDDFALGVNYQDIFALLIKVVQEQNKKIKKLENMINRG